MRYFTQPVVVYRVATWQGDNFADCKEAIAGVPNTTLTINEDGTLNLQGALRRSIPVGGSFDGYGNIYSDQDLAALQEVGPGPSYTYDITEA